MLDVVNRKFIKEMQSTSKTQFNLKNNLKGGNYVQRIERCKEFSLLIFDELASLPMTEYFLRKNRGK